MSDVRESRDATGSGVARRRGGRFQRETRKWKGHGGAEEIEDSHPKNKCSGGGGPWGGNRRSCSMIRLGRRPWNGETH